MCDAQRRRRTQGLVTRYREGNSVNMDPAEAARLLKLASDMGDGQTVSSLGYTLTTGKGVLVDPQGAKT